VSAARTDVLIVEDDTLYARLLSRFCRTLGHDPRVAMDGAEGIEAVREKVPDLVLLDLMLPQIDGFGVLAAIRNDQALRTVPVVIVTAVTDISTHARLVDAGATDIALKPFRFKTLKARIESALATRRYLAEED
jgi:DNA-binding response OmpR family regulator